MASKLSRVFNWPFLWIDWAQNSDFKTPKIVVRHLHGDHDSRSSKEYFQETVIILKNTGNSPEMAKYRVNMESMKRASCGVAVFLLLLLAHFWPEHSNLISNKNQIILQSLLLQTVIWYYVYLYF